MSKPMKDRIMANQKERHELLFEYFKLTEEIRLNEMALESLRSQIAQCSGQMIFVDNARTDRNQQEEANDDE